VRTSIGEMNQGSSSRSRMEPIFAPSLRDPVPLTHLGEHFEPGTLSEKRQSPRSDADAAGPNLVASWRASLALRLRDHRAGGDDPRA
jgi:hypothetical protein